MKTFACKRLEFVCLFDLSQNGCRFSRLLERTYNKAPFRNFGKHECQT